MFKLSFVYANWAEEGILLLFLFVLISQHSVFIARSMFELLNVTARMYPSAAVTRAMSSVVSGSVVCVK